ncbi:MAG: T9SS type A sorting domain-containing protein [Bacteroidetes bacterium]|nr:T9SS type A sorting domain-containing protein [Bacteroidota bacterium]
MKTLTIIMVFCLVTAGWHASGSIFKPESSSDDFIKARSLAQSYFIKEIANSGLFETALPAGTPFFLRQADNGHRQQVRFLKNSGGEMLLETLFQEWDQGYWVNESLQLNYYDGSLYLISTELYTWDENTWKVSSRTLYTNDPQGTILEAMTQVWDPDGSVWVDFIHMVYTYNPNGMPSELFMEMYFGGFWMNASKFFFTWDAQNNLLNTLQQSWDMIGSVWVDEQKETYYYDAGYNILEILEEEWDGAAWVNEYRELYYYNAQGQNSEKESYYWDGAWVHDYHFIYTYGVTGLIDEELQEYWNGANYVNHMKIFFTYDVSGRLTEELAMRWATKSKGWENEDRIQLTYGLVGTGDITTDHSLEINLFPNPASLYVNVVISGEVVQDEVFSLSTITGQTLLEIPVSEEKTRTIDISRFSEGLYIWTLSSCKGKRCGKLVVK